QREIEELLEYAAGRGPVDSPAIHKLSGLGVSATIPSIPDRSSPRLKIGQELASRYRVISGPQGGGMGQVYRAFDTKFRDIVAIKVLHPDFLNRLDFANLLDRFRREAEILRRVEHPNICTVYDIGHDEGIDFIVMDYVEGEMLSARLE